MFCKLRHALFGLVRTGDKIFNSATNIFYFAIELAKTTKIYHFLFQKHCLQFLVWLCSVYFSYQCWFQLVIATMFRQINSRWRTMCKQLCSLMDTTVHLRLLVRKSAYRKKYVCSKNTIFKFGMIRQFHIKVVKAWCFSNIVRIFIVEIMNSSRISHQKIRSNKTSHWKRISIQVAHTKLDQSYEKWHFWLKRWSKSPKKNDNFL